MRPHDEVRLHPREDPLGQRVVRGGVRQVLRTGVEAHEGPPSAGGPVADAPAEHRVAGLERVEHGPLGDGPGAHVQHVPTKRFPDSSPATSASPIGCSHVVSGSRSPGAVEDGTGDDRSMGSARRCRPRRLFRQVFVAIR
jgi:hypothetical protein